MIDGLITPFDKLVDEAKEIQTVLETSINADNIQDVIAKGSMLVEYQARSGKMLADAKYHLNKKKFSIKDSKQVIDYLTIDERMLVDWFDRLNSSCTHQIDWLRTLVSKAKEEMRLSGYQK